MQWHCIDTTIEQASDKFVLKFYSIFFFLCVLYRRCDFSISFLFHSSTWHWNDCTIIKAKAPCMRRVISANAASSLDVITLILCKNGIPSKLEKPKGNTQEITCFYNQHMAYIWFHLRTVRDQRQSTANE